MRIREIAAGSQNLSRETDRADLSAKKKNVKSTGWIKKLTFLACAMQGVRTANAQCWPGSTMVDQVGARVQVDLHEKWVWLSRETAAMKAGQPYNRASALAMCNLKAMELGQQQRPYSFKVMEAAWSSFTEKEHWILLDYTCFIAKCKPLG